MPKIEIEIRGVSAELVLGNYMPKDPTIYENWEEFYHYDDLIHESQLLTDYIAEIVILKDGDQVFKGSIPVAQFTAQKSFAPAMQQNALYLRTECVENAVYRCDFEMPEFELSKLTFETQDYDLLFKVGKSFIVRLAYDSKPIELTWTSATPIGNICLLCRFDNGFLIPTYDVVNKIEAKSNL